MRYATTPPGQLRCIGAVITVVRNAAWRNDLLRRYRILVDGEVRARLRRGEEAELTVSAGMHTVQARIDWVGSRAVSVELAEGEQASFVVNPRSANPFRPLWAIFERRSYLELTRLVEPGST